MKKTAIIILLICVLFVMGARSRYGPFIWQTVSGGIQYTKGNVNITAGNLTASGALTAGSIDGESITDNTIDDDSIDFSDVYLNDLSWPLTDIELIMKTVIKTVNLDSSDDDEDFEFDDSQGNTTEQTVDLGNLIPAYAEILSAQLRCFETVTDAGGDAVLAIDIGTTDGGAEIFGTADVDSADDISATAAGDGPDVVATNAVRKVWINATPDVNWDTLLSGRWSVMVTFIDYESMHTIKNP